MAEIKIKSPVEGVLGKMEDIEKIAKEYQRGGADMISAVTEEKLFGGDLSIVKKIKKVTKLPALCKDFIREEKQLNYVKKAGADAVLLIAFLVDRQKLRSLYRYAGILGLEVVTEVDNEKNLMMAIEEKFPVIAVNARNLKDLSVDREKAVRLIKKIPENKISLAFSGVRDNDDVRNYLNAGAKGVLIGTSLMRAKNKIAFLRKIKSIS